MSADGDRGHNIGRQESGDSMETVTWRAFDPAKALTKESVPECEIRIVSYIDEDGEPMYCYSATDGMPISQGVGLLTMVSHSLEHHMSGIPDVDEDEEDD